MRQQVGEAVNPVIGLPFGKRFGIAVAVTDSADFNAGAAAGFHICFGIAHEQAVLRVCIQSFDGVEQNVGFWFVAEPVGALYMVEVLR